MSPPQATGSNGDNQSCKSIDWTAILGEYNGPPTVYGGLSCMDHDGSTINGGGMDSRMTLSTTPTPATVNNQASSARPERNIHHRPDGLTDPCLIYSPEISTPVQKFSNVTTAKFHCPRCLSNMTRCRTVKDHFPACIKRYGNPDRLKYTDHPSMAGAEKKRLETLNDLGLGNNFDGENEDINALINAMEAGLEDLDHAPTVDSWVGAQLSTIKDECGTEILPSLTQVPVFAGPPVTPAASAADEDSQMTMLKSGYEYETATSELSTLGQCWREGRKGTMWE